MVTVTTAELSPFVVGIVYCGVILACEEVFEVGRARDWTLALSEWAAPQRDLVAFTGRCLVHRAQILQLSGSWSDALEEARRAASRFVETKNPAAGVAHYRQAELLRLRGEFAAAAAAYREASRCGWEPQPGLAQLRLAQGKRDAALAAIRRASAEIAHPLKRAALLPRMSRSRSPPARSRKRGRHRASCASLRAGTRARCSRRSPLTREGRSHSPKARRTSRSSACARPGRSGSSSTRPTRSRARGLWLRERVLPSATRRRRRSSSRPRARSSSGSELRPICPARDAG